MTFKGFIAKVPEALARFFSAIMSPLLSSVYGVFLALWVSVLCYIPFGTRMMVLFVTAGITCLLPMVFIAVLHNAKIITDKRLINHRERWLPLIFALCCYVAAVFYLQSVHSPMWLIAMMWGGVAAIAIGCVITVWWKISLHAAGVAGILALLMNIHAMGLGAFSLFGTICVAIVLCGVVCTSRMILGRHDFAQVLAGFALGYFCVWTMMRILG